MTSLAAGRPFPREPLAGPTLEAARALLGAYLVRDAEPTVGADEGSARVGRIVELEAYIGEDDQASHARMGRTPRNQTMFGPPGHAYVYLVYGMHHCLNVVTEPPSTPAALLVRAVEPVAGLGAMRAARERGRARRGLAVGPAAARPGNQRIADARLAAGPGLVAAAFDIDRSFDGLDLCDPGSPLRLVAPADTMQLRVETTPRIGIGYAGEPWVSVPWRFTAIDSPSISGRRPAR